MFWGKHHAFFVNETTNENAVVVKKKDHGCKFKIKMQQISKTQQS